ncbi:MAG: triose-phosphate isomerase [Fidelibacterota bacterium]
MLYGGSVNRDNSAELLKAKGVDGFLIGGASLKVLDFFTIYQKFNKELN